MRRILICLALPTILSGCIAKTALDVATAPVRAASKAVDLATTSQSEADEKRGRDLRRREEQLGKLERKYRKLDEECRDGKRSACDDRDDIADEIDDLKATLPQRYPDE